MNFNCPLILASSSPRRKFLLHQIGLQFEVRSPGIDESFPADMPPARVPAWLAEKKSLAIPVENEIVISSDTVVILGNKIMNKPADRNEAIGMLSELSGKTHRVITAVCLRSKKQMQIFDDTTHVTFRNLTQDEIINYIDYFKPLDKAGSYGAQDCLPPGMNPCNEREISFLKRMNKQELIENSIQSSSDNSIVIIDKLEGAYFTVMGLPIDLVYERLEQFNC